MTITHAHVSLQVFDYNENDNEIKRKPQTSIVYKGSTEEVGFFKTRMMIDAVPTDVRGTLFIGHNGMSYTYHGGNGKKRFVHKTEFCSPDQCALLDLPCSKN